MLLVVIARPYVARGLQSGRPRVTHTALPGVFEPGGPSQLDGQ